MIKERTRRRARLCTLDSRQIESVLARNRVGRIAFVVDGRVELFPVHYVYDDRMIYGRTGMGLKYLTWLIESSVVFEVDEWSGVLDWRSVIVRGSVSLLRSRGTQAEQAAYLDAVTALRILLPAAMGADDPLPQRRYVFKLSPAQLTGRSSRSTRE